MKQQQLLVLLLLLVLALLLLVVTTTSLFIVEDDDSNKVKQRRNTQGIIKPKPPINGLVENNDDQIIPEINTDNNHHRILNSNNPAAPIITTTMNNNYNNPPPISLSNTADLITNLPGLSYHESNKRRMFSGYIPVEGNGRQLFYWFVESDKGLSAPIVLWTNGGPGCSGLLGFLTEQGPFRPDRNGKLIPNEYAWTKLVNMIFIEQPVGVGFSTPDPNGEKSYGDSEAARDNYRFIINFFVRYPELRNNEFYISSESYGGHYMPTLAKELIDLVVY